MDSQQVLTAGQTGLHLLLMIAAPIVLVVLVVGLVVNIFQAVTQIKATLNKPSKISAQTWMTQFFGLLCLSRGPFGQFAGR
jgi:flagellar biosynthetic protein FliQ